jgi:pyruvate kinase
LVHAIFEPPGNGRFFVAENSVFKRRHADAWLPATAFDQCHNGDGIAVLNVPDVKENGPMNAPSHQPMQETAASVLEEVRSVRAAVIEHAGVHLKRWNLGDTDVDGSLANLAHYLALRNIDLRPLQRLLMVLGLSSLGRLESRVLPTLEAVENALCALAGLPSDHVTVSPAQFFAGEIRLTDATDRLFGTPPLHRRGRIMVTIPGEAATSPALLADLAQRGMDVARINCAHDNPDIWRTLVIEIRKAAEQVGRQITILMDIAGPKIRTEEVINSEKAKKLQVGDAFRLVAGGAPFLSEGVHFAASVSMPEIVTHLATGDRVRYDDGKLEGYVEAVADNEAIVRVTQAKAGGAKLKAEKGLNLPDTDLGLSPLTAKDEADLAVVLECADMIGYSFVRRPDDIDLLEAAIGRLGASARRPGLVAKIEQPEAVKNLPDLIARARPRWRFGVMIARGDLAAEIGFERLAEMQEEILWICEAASVPVIWATQVLEDLVKEGVPSRGEMTDAAMAARAECVMLNKGPAIREGLMLLDRLLTRMDGHMLKKTPTLRALKAWS